MGLKLIYLVASRLFAWARLWMRASAMKDVEILTPRHQRILRAEDVTVVDVDRPDRRARRAHGKSDPVDAYAAATAVLSGRAAGTPKTRDGIVEAIRALRVVRASAVKTRTQTVNQIRGLIITAPAAVRDPLRNLTTARLVARLTATRPGTDVTDPQGRGPRRTAPAGPALATAHH